MAKKIMSKKEMLKEQARLKKEKKMLEEDVKKEDLIKSLLMITVGVVAFLAIAYFGMNIIKGNIKFGKEETVIDDTIDKGVICGTLLTQEETEYYVLAYSFKEDDTKKLYSSIMSMYQGTIYQLDTDSALNNTCVGEKLDINNDISKLQLTSPTLLHIKDKKIDKSYTTYQDILKVLSGN